MKSTYNYRVQLRFRGMFSRNIMGLFTKCDVNIIRSKPECFVSLKLGGVIQSDIVTSLPIVDIFA